MSLRPRRLRWRRWRTLRQTSSSTSASSVWVVGQGQMLRNSSHRGRSSNHALPVLAFRPLFWVDPTHISNWGKNNIYTLPLSTRCPHAMKVTTRLQVRVCMYVACPQVVLFVVSLSESFNIIVEEILAP